MRAMKIFEGVFAVAFLTILGCDAKDENLRPLGKSNDTSVKVIIEAPEVVFCHDGDLVTPLSVSGKSWEKGLGKTTASILIGNEVLDSVSSYSSIQLNNEPQSRKIKSSRVLPNGRNVVIFEGDLVTDPDVSSPFCLRGEEAE